jgi:site-specific DNA recombinase
LSRKYAYQVLLTEEFARHGVETIFLKAPHSDTPEDQLMVQAIDPGRFHKSETGP